MKAGYTQCRLQYTDRNNMVGVAWVRNTHNIHRGASLNVGDSKSTLEPVIVLEVYDSTDRQMHEHAENWHKNKRRTDI